MGERVTAAKVNARIDDEVLPAIQKLGNELKAEIKANSLNGAATVIHKLEPLADATEDLVIMARDHREQRDVEKAKILLDAVSQRTHVRRQEELMGHWWFRRYIGIRTFMGDSGSKLYYAILGGAGFYLVSQTWQTLGPLVVHLFHPLNPTHH